MQYQTNLFIKFFIIILLLLNAINKNDNQIEDNNSLEYYFTYSICKFLYFQIKYNCSDNIFIDYNFYENIVEISQNINLYINMKKTKIEIIFLLVGIIPFLKNNSVLVFKINNIEIFKLFKIIFNKKKIKNKIIKLNENDLHIFIENFNHLMYYKWELIPFKKILNNIRYIINNYYNESCVEIFDKSLNLNFKYYIQNEKKLSSKEIMDLMSKFFSKITTFIYRKYRNL